MKIFAKIAASFGIFLLYGMINQFTLLAQGRSNGPNGIIGLILGIALIAGLVAIWRKKPSNTVDSEKLDKYSEK